MKTSQIPSFMELLEPRLLLDGELAEYQLVLADLDGAPIAAIQAGQDFQLIVQTNDLRATPQGVWAGYLDVAYDGQLVHPTSVITYGDAYPNGQAGSTATSGLLEEVGGFAGAAAPGAGPILLFSIAFHADAYGSAIFAGNAADSSPGHDTLLFGLDDAVVTGQILYGQAAVSVQETEAPTAGLADPANGGSIVGAVINARGYIDVTFADTGGSGLDASTIADGGAEFTLSGPGAGTAVVDGAAELVAGTTSTYRYSFFGSLVAGSVNVDFAAGTWADNDGNVNVAETEGFTVTQGAPEIAVSGNGQAIADGDTTPAPADGTDVGDADVEAAVTHTFTITNSGTGPLSVTDVQISGDNVDDFTVTVSPADSVAGGGGSTTFTLQFSPSGTGVRTATVTIANSDADEGAYRFDVQGTGGRSVAFGGKTKATYRDADGDTVTVVLADKGSGLVWLPTVDPQGQADASSIVLEGTGPKSALTITTTGVGSATTVGGILVLGDSSLGTITGKTTTLNGAITVPGLLGAVTLDDALAGSSIDVNATGVLPGTTQLVLTFDRVTDTSVTVLREPIKSIRATEWANTAASDVEQIAAPWIGTITTVGRKANARANPPVVGLAGDFTADLAISGQGAPAKTLALATVKIAGSVSGTSWDVNGDAGAITIAGPAEGWTLQGEGTGLRTVKTLTLSDVHDTTVLASGAVGAVKALNWGGGAIAADSLTSLSITGRKAGVGVAALPGDFRNADLTLRANAARPAGKATIIALGSATIAGSLVDSAWAVDMDAGAITATGGADGWTLAGADDTDTVDLLSAKSLTLGDVAGASVTVKTAQLNVTSATGQVSQVTAGGMLGAVRALRWAAGTIQAESLTSISITGRKQSVTASEVLGDFGADVTLGGGNIAAKKPTVGAVSVAHDLSESVWQVTGSMATLAVTRTALNSTVRSSGSIASITLGAGDGSNFLAGVTSDQKLDPAAVTAADMEPTGLAMIGSVTIKGWTIPVGQAAPDFLTGTSFLAPSLGAVRVLNGDTPATWDVYVLTTAAGLRIKSILLKDSRAPKEPSVNWTWTPAKNVPAGAGGTANQIPSP